MEMSFKIAIVTLLQGEKKKKIEKSFDLPKVT